MPDQFVHLHLHTEFSLVDGLIRIKPLMNAVAEAGVPAVALTDFSNMFALVKFYRAAISKGIKPIIGADLALQSLRENEAPSRVVLLCQNDEGYRNLTRLVTRAYLEGQHGDQPTLQRDWLAAASTGLIALSGGREGDIGKALLGNNVALADELMSYWRSHFPGRYYLELQRTGRDQEEDYIHSAVKLASAIDIPVVATNDTRFIAADDFEAHEARVCIHDSRVLNDPRRPRVYSEQQYLRTPREMAVLFEDIPEALENTVEIAKRCNLSLSFGENVLPIFPVPKGMSTNDYLTQSAQQGLAERLQHILDKSDPDYDSKYAAYTARLQRELEVIINMGYPGYFLIVADFIDWALNHGVPVGPGRGSGAGSLVAYALKITDLDPLEYDLLFERFLNPERVSMPDFDIDFCMEGRDRVIDYVAQRYGREKVSQIITYGTMAAKAVVRDVGRVMGQSYGFVDRIAKMIPFEIGMTLEKALEQETELRELYEKEEDVHTIIDMALSLEGLARNAGKHAGGVVISPTELTDFTPLYCEQGGQSVVTQLDKDDVEAIGLVKFDFLGLRTLTIIDKALQNIAKRESESDESIDISKIPLDDEAAYVLLQDTKTVAVFQLESTGIREIIKRLKPDKFEDVVALVALYRPGPLQSGMVDDFINRKHGAKVTYPHPDIEPILRPTYGVILYQEQVMQIAQVLAGYTLGGADLLRRAMGKKKAEEMAKQRAIFVGGATERGVKEKVATYIFDLMEKFAGYGFNKSHSVAYALLAYQTAWLKAHYPAEFMAAVMSADMDNTDKVVNFINDCRDTMGLDVVPPDVNRSDYAFSVFDDRTILYGLGAVKGAGRAAIESILQARELGGGFADLDDLCQRIDSQKVNRRVLDALIRAGAMDVLGPNRASLMAHLPKAVKLAEQTQRDMNLGQEDLFGGGDVIPKTEPCELRPEWDEDQRLLAEKETLGLYLTGHPFERYEAELRRIAAKPIADLSVQKPVDGGGYGGRNKEQQVTVAGLIATIRTRNSQSGRIAFITLDDRSGRLEVSVFGDDYRRYGHLLTKDKILVIEGGLGLDEYTGTARLRARRILDIEQARTEFAKYIQIQVNISQPMNGLIGHMQEVLSPYREGKCPVCIDLTNRGANAQIALDESWRVLPADELLQRLRDLEGVQHVDVIYA